MTFIFAAKKEYKCYSERTHLQDHYISTSAKSTGFFCKEVKINISNGQQSKPWKCEVVSVVWVLLTELRSHLVTNSHMGSY